MQKVKEEKGRGDFGQEAVDYTEKSSVLANPCPAAVSPHEMALPRVSRVNVDKTSAGTVSVDMTVVGRLSGCSGWELLDMVRERPKQRRYRIDVHHVKQRKDVELPNHLLDNRHPKLQLRLTARTQSSASIAAL